MKINVASMIPIDKTLNQVQEKFNAFIIDIWGVIHDGNRLYPGVNQALTKLHERNKKIIFISNTDISEAAVSIRLEEMGLDRRLYDKILTAGDQAFVYFLEKIELNEKKNSYYQLSTPDCTYQLPEFYQKVDQIKDANFLLLVNYFDIEKEKLTLFFEEAISNSLILFCLNPDKFVINQEGQQFFCAGIFAELYENLGGKVFYFGKPYSLIYERALKLLSNYSLSEIAAIGDSLKTDILGANQMDLFSILIASGVSLEDQFKFLKNKKELVKNIFFHCQTLQIFPKLIVESFKISL